MELLKQDKDRNKKTYRYFFSDNTLCAIIEVINFAIFFY